MNTTDAVVRPDPEAWAAIPRSASAARQTVVAWLIVLVTFGLAFVVDSWREGAVPESVLEQYRMVDVFVDSAMIVAVLFALFGWWLGRLSVAAAPVVLFYAAVSITLCGYSSALIWWAGAVAATHWCATQTRSGLRQIDAIAIVVEKLNGGATSELGPVPLGELKRITRHSKYWAYGLSAVALGGWLVVFLTLPSIVGRPYQDDTFAIPQWLAPLSFVVGTLALVQWYRCALRAIARSRVGDWVWDVPAHVGPVRRLLVPLSRYVDVVSATEARTSACTCVEDDARTNLGDNELIETSVFPSVHCPLHGIDLINSFTSEQFRSEKDRDWIWDAIIRGIVGGIFSPSVS